MSPEIATITFLQSQIIPIQFGFLTRDTKFSFVLVSESSFAFVLGNFSREIDLILNWQSVYGQSMIDSSFLQFGNQIRLFSICIKFDIILESHTRRDISQHFDISSTLIYCGLQILKMTSSGNYRGKDLLSLSNKAKTRSQQRIGEKVKQFVTTKKIDGLMDQ